MTTNRLAKMGRQLLLLLPLIIAPITFFALLPHLKSLGVVLIMGITAVFAFFVMGYSAFLARRVARRWDEVEIASHRYAQTTGMQIGYAAFVLMLLFPPALDALAELATSIAGGKPETATRVGIAIGFIVLVMLQTLGAVVSAIWWQRRLHGKS